MARRLCVVIAAVLLWTQPAHADRIVFECGTAFQNLCSIAPDGTGRTELIGGATGTGTDRYASPSLSADGTKLAFLYKGDAYVVDTATGTSVGPVLNGFGLVIRMRPDGGAVAAGELSTGNVCLYTASLTGRDCVGASGSFGFAANGDLLSQAGSGPPDYRRAICRFSLSDATSGCDGPAIITDPANDLADPTTSPDGTKIAVTRSAPGAEYGRIAIYDAATDTLLNEVSSGPDAFPAWSPDSQSVAFTRQSGGVWIASATGAPGAEHELVADGRSPTWGAGGPDAAPAPAATCTVPKLTGLRSAKAVAKLERAGCAAPKVKRRHAARRQRGRVIAQSAAAGSAIAATKTVTLTVGK